ncbi:hypothetical protein MMC32_007021 [Xylographa parallela]|nr:hypothetical protein [Xylographa parallela]
MDPYLASTGRYSHCLFVKFQKGLPSRILKSDVHTLDSAAKTHLFRASSAITDKQSNDAAMVLERLRSISPTVARNFEIKSNVPETMTMRLLNQSSDYTEVENSYITLSYCWPSKNRTPGVALVHPIYLDEYPLPVSQPLFQALSAECRSPREGIWCDQICINQDDEVEKAVMISAMDVVYKCARVVVVALDDIEISVEEHLLLLRYTETDRYLKSSLEDRFDVQTKSSVMGSDPVFCGLFEKILGARWFSRAWCAYEMRLASNHVFVIRCTTEDETSETVLRFDSSFLSHLLALAVPVQTFGTGIYDLLPALIGTFGGLDARESEASHQIEADLSGVEEKVALATAELKRQNLEAHNRPLRSELKDVSELRSSLNKSLLRVFLEVFELQAGGDPRLPPGLREQNANEDKMSIVLNTIASGIIYRKPPDAQGEHCPSTDDQCCRQLLLLVLAMHDPIVLCTTGRPLQLGGNGTSRSWLAWPETRDIRDSLPPMSMLDIAVDPSYMAQYIRLDLLFLGERESYRRPSELKLSIAKEIIIQFSKLNLDDRAHFNFWDYVSGENILLMEREAQTLACMLDCGESWISLVSRTCGYAGDAALQGSLHLFFEQIRAVHGRNDLHWLKTNAGKTAAMIMLDFAYYVTLAGIPSFAMHDDAWTPILIDVEENNPTLIFSPLSRSDERHVHLAVPTAVLADAYESLPRVWILRHRQDQSFELLGKSRMLGGGSIAGKKNDKWQIRDKQFVYGPQEFSGSR